MSNKPKRKEKPKRQQHQQLIRYGLATLLILGLLIVSMFNEQNGETEYTPTLTSISRTNQAVEVALNLTRTQNAIEDFYTETVQAVNVTSTPCAFMWAYRPNDEMTAQVENALATTALTFNDIQAIHYGETHCDDYLIFDTTITINFAVAEYDIAEALEIIIPALPELNTQRPVYLDFGFVYGDDVDPEATRYRTLYDDIRRAYTEGLRGEELLDMGR